MNAVLEPPDSDQPTTLSEIGPVDAGMSALFGGLAWSVRIGKPSISGGVEDVFAAGDRYGFKLGVRSELGEDSLYVLSGGVAAHCQRGGDVVHAESVSVRV